jgi:hypothetical protein
VGNGTDVYLDSQTATFTSFQSSGPGRHFWSATIQPTNNSPSWGITFTLPNSGGLIQGKRLEAGIPVDLSSPGMAISRGGALACPRQSGSFIFHQIGPDPTTLGSISM